MNISLTRELEKLIAQKLKSGRYQTASEVVRDGLRLLEERDHLFAARLGELRQDIRKGLESGPATPFDAKSLKKRVRERIAHPKRSKAQ